MSEKLPQVHGVGVVVASNRRIRVVSMGSFLSNYQSQLKHLKLGKTKVGRNRTKLLKQTKVTLIMLKPKIHQQSS